MDAVNVALFADPSHHPDCCVAISRSLLDTLARLLPRAPATVLSIGSGTGLLEALLLRHVGDTLDLHGVEVSARVNKYLPEEKIVYVSGTWHLSEQAANASVWLFVYPREPKLLSRYIHLHAHDRLSKIIWLGPKMDWQDYEGIFAASKFNSLTIIEGCGVVSYEMMAVAETPCNM